MAYEVVWRWKLTNNCILLLVVLLLQIFWKLWAVECSNFMQIGGGSQWFTECEHARTNVWFKLLDPGKTQVAREVDYVTLLKNAKHLFFHRDFLSALLGNRSSVEGKTFLFGIQTTSDYSLRIQRHSLIFIVYFNELLHYRTGLICQNWLKKNIKPGWFYPILKILKL